MKIISQMISVCIHVFLQPNYLDACVSLCACACFVHTWSIHHRRIYLSATKFRAIREANSRYLRHVGMACFLSNLRDAKIGIDHIKR